MSGWIVGFGYICEYGHRVTESYQEISDCLYECPWYEMPLKVKKCFPIMMAVAQRPIYIYGCLNIRCIRVTYRKVGIILNKTIFIHIETKFCSLFSFCMLQFLTSWYWERLFEGKKLGKIFGCMLLFVLCLSSLMCILYVLIHFLFIIITV